MFEDYLQNRGKIQLMLIFLKEIDSAYSRDDFARIFKSAKVNLDNGALFEQVIIHLVKRASELGMEEEGSF